MDNLWISITSAIIGIIGTLLVQYFSSKIEIERNKESETRKLLNEKYKQFKQYYILYKSSYKNMLNAKYKYIFISNFNFSSLKDKIEIFETIRDTYEEHLKNLIGILEEDDYLYKKLISCDEVSMIFSNLSSISLDIKHIIVVWKFIDKLDKNKLLASEEGYYKCVNEMNNKILELKNNFQEKLYKDIC